MLSLYLENLHFEAAHYLPGHPECGEVHGHTYVVSVEVTGELVGGMIVDFADLKKVVRGCLPDHVLLNDKMTNPTVENLALMLFDDVAAALESFGVTLVKLKVSEGLWKGATVCIDAECSAACKAKGLSPDDQLRLSG